MENVKKALKYLKPYIFIAILSMFLSILMASAESAPVLLIKKFIGNIAEDKNEKKLIIVAILIVVISLLKGVIFYFRKLSSEFVANRMVKDIRTDIFNHLNTLPLDFFSKNEIGQIMARFTNDAQQLQVMVSNFFTIITKIVTIVILFAYALITDWKLLLMIILFFPSISYFIGKYSKKINKAGKKIQEKIGTINSLLQESLSGIRVIKAFSAEKYENEKFEKENNENYKAIMKNVRLTSRVRPAIEFFNAISVGIILYYGGLKVIDGNLKFDELVAFIMSLALIYDPIKKIATLNNGIQTALPSVGRIFEILETKTNIIEKINAKVLSKVKGDVELKNVSFAYDEKLVLKNISLKASSGEVVALVGKSGSGKTTLVNLIPRFYNVNNGNILLDNYKINDLNIKSLRDNIGIVPQDTFLFAGTIYDNIIYGSWDASYDKVMEAAKFANAYDFINELENGFETQVGERGVLLSGGQKQRIAIARALLKNPKILILDEATSALDTESEKLVQEALDKLMKKRTTFVIAHRLSTIINADKIAVMDDGKLIEIGSHLELIEKDGAYKKLYDRQFKS